MKSLESLIIDQPYIALFGSGNSVNEMSPQEFAYLKSRAFVITLNYAPLKIQGHLNMWSDRKVGEFLNEHYRNHPKECMFLAQGGRVPSPLKEEVDFWFQRQKQQLQGNFTLVWALQLIQQYFPHKTVLLFGVDMYAPNNHHAKWYDSFTDFDRNKRGTRYNSELKLGKCAEQLVSFVRPEKVFNCNPKSALQHFEKREWQLIVSLDVVQLAPTALAGAPVHLSKIINKYTGSTSTSWLQKPFRAGGNLGNLAWDYDHISPAAKTLKSAIAQADLLHHHRKIWEQPSAKKPAVLQYHSPPKGYKPLQTDAPFNSRKLVIAQYHPRYYRDAEIVPNMIDIWDELFMPAAKPTDRVRIFYSWASETASRWSNKGSAKTQEILKEIQTKYGKAVEIVVVTNRPHAECMREKQTAQLVIDECVTGSYHLQSLEGCSVGALTINNIDEQTAAFMQTVSGAANHPFVTTAIDGLFDTLCHYIDRPELLVEEGNAARLWMEQHWDPRILVKRFMVAYFNTLMYGTVAAPTEQISPAKEAEPLAPPLIVPRAKNKPTEAMAARKLPVAPVVPQAAEKLAPPPARVAIGRSIVKLYRKYEGKDIYIFGTGPSLFTVNPDRFRNEICFGINFAFEVMPHMDWHFAHVIETYEAMKTAIDPATLILPETLVRQWNRGGNQPAGPNRIAPDSPTAFVYPIQDPHGKVISSKSVSIEKDARMFTWSCTTHSAIHMAAYMGAKNIYLVGVDYKPFKNGRTHFDSTHLPSYGQQNWNALSKHRTGDQWLANELQKQGVNLVNLSTQKTAQRKAQVRIPRTKSMLNP